MRLLRSKNPKPSDPSTPKGIWMGPLFFLAANLLGASGCEKDKEQEDNPDSGQSLEDKEQKQSTDTRQSLEAKAEDRKKRIKVHCESLCSEKYQGCKALRFDQEEDRCPEACFAGLTTWFEELVLHELILKYEDLLSCALQESCEEATKILEEEALNPEPVKGTPCDAQVKLLNDSAFQIQKGSDPVVMINKQRWAAVYGVVHSTGKDSWKVTLTNDEGIDCSTNLSRLDQFLSASFYNKNKKTPDRVEVELQSDDDTKATFSMQGNYYEYEAGPKVKFRGPVGATDTYALGTVKLIDCTDNSASSR